MTPSDILWMTSMASNKRLDIVIELLKRDPKSPIEKVMQDADRIVAWSFSNAPAATA